MDNCLLYALRIWRFGRDTDHLLIRRSHWGWFPHFAVVFELADGTLIKKEYVPNKPRPSWLPPLFFKGREVTTIYRLESVESIYENPMKQLRNILAPFAIIFLVSLGLGIGASLIGFGPQAKKLSQLQVAQAADFVYDSVLDDAFTGNILKTDTYKCALINSTGVSAASISTHTRFNQVTGEITGTGTGYTAGGVTVVPTFTKDTTNHRLTVTIPSHTWTSSTLTARGEVCYKSTGTASTSPLLLLNDFTSDVTTSNGTFTVNASAINFNTPQ